MKKILTFDDYLWLTKTIKKPGSPAISDNHLKENMDVLRENFNEYQQSDVIFMYDEAERKLTSTPKQMKF